MGVEVNIDWYWIDLFINDRPPTGTALRRPEGLRNHRLGQSVYVIRLKSPFSIKYPEKHSPTLYIGEGNLVARLATHCRRWAGKLHEQGFSLEVAYCFPRVPHNARAYKTFEAHLIQTFTERYGSLPLQNVQHENPVHEHHRYPRRATGEVLGPRTGVRHLWAIPPLRANPFIERFNQRGIR